MTTSPLIPLSPLTPLTHSFQTFLQHKHHHYSNYASWLIPSRVLIGESPSPPEDRNATSHRIHSICHSAKCRTFVCLQAEASPQTLGAMVVGGGYEDWRRDKTKKVGPTYYYHVRKILEVGEKVEYVHYGMRRQGGNSGDKRERKGQMICSMESLRELLDELKRRVCQGEIIYLHAGGTNDQRISIVAAGLLGWLYPSMGVVEAGTRTELYCGLQRRKLGFGGDWVGEGDDFCPIKRFGAGSDNSGNVHDLLSLREKEKVQENEDENEVEEFMHKFKPEDVVVNPIKLSDDDDDVYSGLLQETTKYKRSLSLDTITTASSSISHEIESNDEGSCQNSATSIHRGEEEGKKEHDITNQLIEYHRTRRQQRPQKCIGNNKFVVNIQQVRYSSTRIQEIKSKLRSIEHQYGRAIGV